eukprot:jgi/Tetstr1/456268/TSEL_043028.t1
MARTGTPWSAAARLAAMAVLIVAAPQQTYAQDMQVFQACMATISEGCPTTSQGTEETYNSLCEASCMDAVAAMPDCVKEVNDAAVAALVDSTMQSWKYNEYVCECCPFPIEPLCAAQFGSWTPGSCPMGPGNDATTSGMNGAANSGMSDESTPTPTPTADPSSESSTVSHLNIFFLGVAAILASVLV